jgi:hypothetical protein
MRPNARYLRVYLDGYDISGHARNVGPAKIICGSERDAALGDACKAGLPGQPEIGFESLNVLMDTTAVTGSHITLNVDPILRTVTLSVGVQAIPAMGSPVFAGKFYQMGYQGETTGALVSAAIPFEWPGPEAGVLYANPWGKLLLPPTQKSAANSANTNVDNLAPSSLGGYMIYHITGYTGTGSATISIDDSDTGSSNWVALSGATTGAIAHTAMPCGGVVQLATNALVRQYLRWQLSLNTLTNVTFALAFVRGV